MENVVKFNAAESLLTPFEGAHHLRLHVETIRRWLREGRIQRCYKIGRGWRIPASELERLLAECSIVSNKQPQPIAAA